jgi:hypothetical protein
LPAKILSCDSSVGQVGASAHQKRENNNSQKAAKATARQSRNQKARRFTEGRSGVLDVLTEVEEEACSLKLSKQNPLSYFLLL